MKKEKKSNRTEPKREMEERDRRHADKEEEEEEEKRTDSNMHSWDEWENEEDLWGEEDDYEEEEQQTGEDEDEEYDDGSDDDACARKKTNRAKRTNSNNNKNGDVVKTSNVRTQRRARDDKGYQARSLRLSPEALAQVRATIKATCQIPNCVLVCLVLILCCVASFTHDVRVLYKCRHVTVPFRSLSRDSAFSFT